MGVAWTLTQCDWCPYKMWKFGQTHTKEECHVNMKAEIEVMCLPENNKDYQRTTRSYERGMERILAYSSQKEQTLLGPSTWTSSCQNPETINSCLSHPVCGALLQ